MIGLNFYGLSLALAVFVAYWLTSYRASKRGLDPDLVWQSLPWVLFFGILGARFYHIINFLPFYLNNFWLIPQIWFGGLGIWGAIFGGLGGFWMKWKMENGKWKVDQSMEQTFNSQLSTLNYFDAAAPSVALAQAIGRVGNIINKELLPYAMWELAANLFIFLILIILDQKSNLPAGEAGIKNQNDSPKIKNSGSLFFLYLLSYSAARFILELFRIDSPWVLGPLTVAGWVSLAVMGTATTILILKGQKTLSPPQTDPGSGLS